MRDRGQHVTYVLSMVSILAGIVGIVWIAQCGPSTNLPPEQINPLPTKGATSFTTIETSDGAYARQDATTGTNKTGTPSGRTDAVEEADLYRMSGTTMFYLNTYKGLILFDVSNPRNPKKLSNLPVFGYPIEMFVVGTTAYALVRDALFLEQEGGAFQFKRRYVSQLVSIDLSNLSAPKIMQRLDITGQLQEGVSRKVGNVIYVVSYQARYYYAGWSYQNTPHAEQATVYSYDISVPQNIRQVQSLQLLKDIPVPTDGTSTTDPGTTSVGAGSVTRSSGASGSTTASPGTTPVSSGTTPVATNSNNTSTEPAKTEPVKRESRSFSGITLSATSNALLVTENWYYSLYEQAKDTQCYTYDNYRYSVVNVVDISDPQGTIKVHSRFEVRGHMSDQFKQTYLYEQGSQKGIYLGIFQRNESLSRSCQAAQQIVENNLVSVDVTNGNAPKELHRLQFGKPNEIVRGSVFDNDRKVVYAITAVRTDPLYAMSFADPAQLKILSAVDGLSGDINLFRFVANNKFLLAVGRDNSQTCTGFDQGDGWRTQVAVSLIDVQDLQKVRLVQRKCVAVKNADWVSSEINWNLDQAHKMVGMYSENNVNLITVPVSYYTRSAEGGLWYWYEYKSAIGLLQWDLTKYDPNKNETQQQVLNNLATIVHPQGSVKRTALVNLPVAGGVQRLAINLSDTAMSLVDLQNLQQPAMLSWVEIAPYLRTVYRFGSHLVEQVNVGVSYSSFNEFRVKAVGAADMNDAPVVASFKIGQLQSVIPWNNMLVLFRYPIDKDKSTQEKPVIDYQKSELLLYDFSNPSQPKARGSVVLPYPFYPYMRFMCGGMDMAYDIGRYYYYGSPVGQQWVQTEEGLASLIWQYDTQTQKSINKLLFLNFRQVDQPSFSVRDLPTGYDVFYGVTLSPQQFYLVLRQRVENQDKSDLYTYRYYAQSWTLQNNVWTMGANINLPGRLMNAYQVGNKVKFLTYDYDYIRREIQGSTPEKPMYQYQSIFRLHMLELLSTQQAELKDSTIFEDLTMRDLLFYDQRLYLIASRDWYYFVARSSASDVERSDQFLIFDLSKGQFDKVFSATTLAQNLQLMGIYRNALFLNLMGEGVLVVDINLPSKPWLRYFQRTLGWLSSIVFADDVAFAASGHFGLYQLPLQSSTP